MDDLKDIIKNYKKMSLTIDENELILKKQKLKRQEYEIKIIDLLKQYHLTHKPIHLKNSQIIYKCETKPCSLSQKYLEENINNYFSTKYRKLLGHRYKEEADNLYKFLLDNRPKKTYEKLYEKKSKLNL